MGFTTKALQEPPTRPATQFNNVNAFLIALQISLTPASQLFLLPCVKPVP